MIGGSGKATNIGDYLINFNSSEWANQANAHLQTVLSQGLPYSEKYTTQAVKAVQDYDTQAQNQIKQGFQQAQALNAPQRLATYGALDAYQGTLGLATPAGGSFQLAQAMQNNVAGQPLPPQQQQMVNGYNNGLLSNMPPQRY